MDDETELDALFQLPLGEFIAGRNRVAARLRATGAIEDASRVKALAKPSAAAWAVNQVYWTERAAFDALIEAGANLRAAQRDGGGSEAIREAMRRRRDSLATAVKLAEAKLAASGHGAPTTTVLRIASTFEALAAWEEPGPRAGRLITDLDPPGFEALAGLTLAERPAVPRAAPLPPPSPGSSSAAVSTDEKDVRSRAALAQAEEELGKCRRAEELASAGREAAVQRADVAAQARDNARREAERAEFAAREARAAAEVAQREADATASARVRAEAALDAARSAVGDSSARDQRP